MNAREITERLGKLTPLRLENLDLLLQLMAGDTPDEERAVAIDTVEAAAVQLETFAENASQHVTYIVELRPCSTQRVPNGF